MRSLRQSMLPALCAFVFISAFFMVTLRTEFHRNRYNLAALKKRELALLTQNSQVRMNLAKITSKENLSLLAQTVETVRESRTVASVQH